MRKSMTVFAMLSALTLSASAQTKISGKLNCAKPDVNSSAEVPDAAGHLMTFTKGACTWSAPLDIDGVKSKTAIDVSTAEIHGASGANHGYNVSTMENGDKATASYQGTLQVNKDGSGTFKGTWKFSSGSGKFKGLKGGGTFTGTSNADGTGVADIEGDYTLAAAGKKKTP
jgi:hypothetical protein